MGTVPYFLLIALFICPIFSFAEGLDPYSFNPRSELRPQEYLPSLLPPLLRRDSTKTLNNLRSAPNPVIVTDEAGNVSVYQGGELKLSIDTKGNKTFYLKGLPHFEKDDRDYLTRTYEYSGSRATVKNEWGEVVGYKEFGLGGLLLKEFDEKGRHTKSYEYNGRMTKAMIDHLTNSRTLFNDKGKMEREVNFKGGTLATYYYGANGKLIHKIDNYGNKTVYDGSGRPVFTYRTTGAVIETYNWISRNAYSMTNEHGHTTYYDHDRQQYETQLVETPGGIVTRIVKTYAWQGTKLISSLDIDKEETTHYENGRPTLTINNSNLVMGLWKYDEQTGILISKIDRRDGTITFYDHGQETPYVYTEAFNPDDLTADYEPAGYDEIVMKIREYKDSSHSTADDVDVIWRRYNP